MQGARAPVVRSTVATRRKWPKSGGFNIFLLLAFLFQSFVAQIHIHGIPNGLPYRVNAAASVPASHVPSKDRSDEANCPFCQAVIHAGAFFAPHALLILPPSSKFVSAARFSYVRSIAGFIGHIWQQRAPPAV
jgi:hypothetical protein